jgi:DNA-binding ferritin-like protein
MKVRSNNNRTSKKNKTLRIKNKYSQAYIVTMFLQMLNTVKIYHWETTSYAKHKATDELYSNLNENIDTFVEIMLGKTGKRVDLTHSKSIPLTNVKNFEKEIEKYKQFLINMNKDAGLNITNNSDLLNVRDEILGKLNQFSYLLTLK